MTVLQTINGGANLSPGLKTPEGMALIEVLFAAIPDGVVREFISYYEEKAASGEMVATKAHAIAFYNDRSSTEEVIDWYERALVGIRIREAQSSRDVSRA